MDSARLRFLFVPLAAALLAACGERIDLEVRARIDGQPVSQASVVVDKEALGVTDSQGVFAKQIRKKAGAEVEVAVAKEMPGYRVEPWKTTFLVKLNQSAYRLDADLAATRFVTLRVSDHGAPIEGAAVSAA